MNGKITNYLKFKNSVLLSLRLEREETLKYRCVCWSRSEKLNIISNDHERTQNYDFFCFRVEIPFLSKFGPRIKIFSLS